MARLIVEAVSNTKTAGYPIYLSLLVSVSKAEDGQPVTGLTKENFKLTELGSKKKDGGFPDYDFACSERKGSLKEGMVSGVYDVTINKRKTGIFEEPGFASGELFSFGLQVVQVFAHIHDQGQTVVSLKTPD